MLQTHTGGAWSPFILQPATLTIFILSLVSIFVVLQLNFAESQRTQGIPVSSDKYHYFWTYAPTAVFMLVMSCWRQLDYRIKQLTPWALLVHGPVSASKSILIDYISPFLPMAFLAACKNKHILPILTMIGYLAMKLVLVFATTLFVLETAQITNNDTRFLVSANFSSSAILNLIEVTPKVDVELLSYGILQHGLSQPSWTTSRYAVQPFNLDPVQNTSSTVLDAAAVVDVFLGELGSCEEGTLSGAGSSPNITTPSGWHSGVQTSVEGKGENVNISAVAEYYIGELPSGESSYRFVVLVEQGVLLWTLSSDPANSTGPIYTVLVCEPKFSVQQAKVTLPNTEQGGLSVQTIAGTPMRPLEGVSQANLLSNFTNAFAESQDANIDPISSQISVIYPLLANQTIEIAKLEDAARYIFSFLSALWANEVLLAQDEEPLVLIGSSRREVLRLQFRSLSLIFTQSLFGFLIVILAVIVLKVPSLALSQDPANIGSMAKILSQSPELQKYLAGKGHLNQESLAKWLVDHDETLFSVDLQGHQGNIISIQQNSSKSENQCSYNGFEERPDSKSTILHRETGINVLDTPVTPLQDSRISKWWRPIALMLPVIIPTIVLPLIVAAVLEILYRLLQNNEALLVVSPTSYLHYLWTYLPALIVLSVAAFANLLDITIRTIQPYHNLRTGNALANRSLSYNPSSQMTPHALWNGLKLGQVPVICSTFAALLVPLFTIVVAGLFTTIVQPFSTEVNLSTSNWFNLTSPSSDTKCYYKAQNLLDVYCNDDAAAGIASQNESVLIAQARALDMTESVGLILLANLSYPDWTYSELFFPELEIETLDFNHNASGFIISQLPALRTGLDNCSVMPYDATNIPENFTISSDDAWDNFFSSLDCGKSILTNNSFWPYTPNVILGPNCPVSLNGTNSAINSSDCTKPIDINGPPVDGYFGYFGENLGLNEVQAGSTFIDHPKPHAGCPTLGFVFGHATKGVVDNYTIMVCGQHVEQVLSEVQFTTAPGLAIDVSHPPVVNETSAVWISNNALANIRFYLPTYANYSTYNTIDSFFATILTGWGDEPGVPGSTLLSSPMELSNSVQHLYRVITAQWYSEWTRTNTTSTPANNDIQIPLSKEASMTGSMTGLNRSLIMQNLISTRILQMLLITVSICCALAYFCVETKDVLPMEPTSLAAVWTLLADADLRDDNWMEGPFSLGWWSRDDDAENRLEERFGIDVGSCNKDL